MIRAEKIWEAFPAGSYAISGLMRLLDIRESRSVETAWAGNLDGPVILLNPNFVARYAFTPERQAALILHELLHVLLGHYCRPVTKLDNFIFDALINSMVCYLTRSPAHWSLFTSLYSSQRFPECLLRPPSRFRVPDSALGTAVQMPRVLRGQRMWKARQVYKALYERFGASYEEVRRLFDILARNHAELLAGVDRESVDAIVAEEGTEGLRSDEFVRWAEDERASEEEEPEKLSGRVAPLGKVKLLGSHPVKASIHDGSNESLVRAAAEVLSPLIEAMPRRGEEQIRYFLPLDPSPEADERNVTLLRQLIEKVALDGQIRAPSVTEAPIRLLTAVPATDRRSNVLRFLGLEPLLYGWDVPERVQRRITPVHVYLDVSGSVTPFVASLRKTVLACKELVAPIVHLFSVKVEDIGVYQLAARRIPSWGGTDIHCVLAHMKKHEIRNALILTDGYVGCPAPQWDCFLRNCRLAVALTPRGSLAYLKDFVRFHGWLVSK